MPYTPPSASVSPPCSPIGPVQLEGPQRCQAKSQSPNRSPALYDARQLRKCQSFGLYEPINAPGPRDDLSVSYPITQTSNHAVFTDSEDETEDGPQSKPKIIRKLSGELVQPILRPPSRRRPASMPASPTKGKSVQFHSHLEEAVDFFRLDSPLSISTKSQSREIPNLDTEQSPSQDNQSLGQLKVITPNLPQQISSCKSPFVFLQSLKLNDDKKSLRGIVAVQNLAFEKSVTCRFTFDNWTTISDIILIYSERSISDKIPPGYDKFVFTIDISDILDLEFKTAQLCVRYIVNGQEFWDNNSGHNFRVYFSFNTSSQDGDAKSNVVPSPSGDGLLPLETPIKSMSTSLRRKNFAKYYSITASLDATIQAAKYIVHRSESKTSIDMAGSSFNQLPRSFAKASTIPGMSAPSVGSVFPSERCWPPHALDLHGGLGNDGGYNELTAMPLRAYGLC